MSVKSLKQYKATFDDNTSTSCVAADMEKAAGLLDSAEKPVAILQKIADNVQVDVPDPVFAVETFVDSASVDCKSYPSRGEGVKNGDKVFLSAVAGEGYTFDGWYLGEDKVSSEAEAAITIDSDSEVPATIRYEAKFTAI